MPVVNIMRPRSNVLVGFEAFSLNVMISMQDPNASKKIHSTLLEKSAWLTWYHCRKMGMLLVESCIWIPCNPDFKFFYYMRGLMHLKFVETCILVFLGAYTLAFCFSSCPIQDGTLPLSSLVYMRLFIWYNTFPVGNQANWNFHSFSPIENIFDTYSSVKLVMVFQLSGIDPLRSFW